MAVKLLTLPSTLSARCHYVMCACLTVLPVPLRALAQLAEKCKAIYQSSRWAPASRDALLARAPFLSAARALDPALLGELRKPGADRGRWRADVGQCEAATTGHILTCIDMHDSITHASTTTTAKNSNNGQQPHIQRTQQLAHPKNPISPFLALSTRKHLTAHAASPMRSAALAVQKTAQSRTTRGVGDWPEMCNMRERTSQ
jgi:hypothetical protein